MTVNLQRAAVLLCMAASPGMPADVAVAAAHDLMAMGPGQLPPVPGRKRGIFEQLVNLCEDGELPEPLAIARILPETLRLHVGANIDNEVIDLLRAGQIVAVWRQVGDYLFVSEQGCEPECAGWVLRHFVEAVKNG